MRAPFAPPRLSEPRNVEADAHAVETSCDTDRPLARIFCFRVAMSLSLIRLAIGSRDRVLPDQRLFRHERPEIARARTHVAVRELEPGAGKRVRELVRMFVEAPRDLLVGRVEPQREVRRQHGRHMLLRIVEGVRDVGLRTLRLPLLRAGRTLRQFPFVFEQVLEEEVAPLRRRLRPGDFRAAGDGVGANAGAILALPAEALILDVSAFRLRGRSATDRRRRGSCRRCGRPRSARRFPRRSSPYGKTFRGCPWPLRPGRDCRSGLPD